MSNAARARPVSTGLYMFFLIARLFLLRQPQSGLPADDCNPASASSVNGLLRNEMSFRCAQPRPCAPIPGSRAQPDDCCRLTIRDGVRDHVARLPAAQIGRSEIGYSGRWQASQQYRHGHWMVACSVYLYIVTFGMNLRICRGPGRACPTLTATVTVPPAAPDRLCRTLLPNNSLQGRVTLARVPGTQHPDCERAGDPRPLRPPGHRHALPDLPSSYQRTRLPRPPPAPSRSPGSAGRMKGMHAPLSRARQAGTRGRRGLSVAVRAKPTVHTERPGGRTRSATCPWTPRHSGLQRYKMTHDGTEKKRPASTRISS
jgi:hypothetical protein